MTDRPTLRILSTDAPKSGVRRCATAFTAETGQAVDIDLAPAPIIRERVTSGGATPDIIVATLAVLNEFADAGLAVPESIAPIGSVAVGVVVRNDAPEPDLSSVERFTGAVLAADAIVYNKASSGLYIARMLGDIGVAKTITDKITVVPNGAAVMEYLVGKAPRNAIGFGHITEIRLHDDLGTHLVGALPEAIGRHTVYAVGLHAAAAMPDAARALIARMESAKGTADFVASGVV
jgi:molybdate transport system substrate-binding protein